MGVPAVAVACKCGDGAAGVAHPDAAPSSSTLFIHTRRYNSPTVQRVASGYVCTPQTRYIGPLSQAGCLPQNYLYGCAIKGPAYASIGPPTELTNLSSDREPGLGLSTPFTATLTIRNLTVGRT